MKFEAFILRGLCGAGMLISILVFGAMLFATPTTPAATTAIASAAHNQGVACVPATGAVPCSHDRC